MASTSMHIQPFYPVQPPILFSHSILFGLPSCLAFPSCSAFSILFGHLNGASFLVDEPFKPTDAIHTTKKENIQFLNLIRRHYKMAEEAAQTKKITLRDFKPDEFKV